MQSDEFISRIQLACREYLGHQMTARALVSQIDDLVADEYPEDLAGELAEALETFHLWAALYVEDPDMRREYDGYIGEPGLKTHVGEFLKKLGDTLN